jgi:polysaccharide deacetylase 2 family uncharacterized protein YibQ
MYRLKPIRRARRPRPPRALFEGANTAFWVMLGVAVIFGGGRAIGGIPALAGAILPHGVVAAEASDAPQFVGVRLRVAYDEFGPSKFAPQVLYPVVYHSFPDWLSRHEARDIASATELPAAPPGTTPTIAIVVDDLGPDLAHTDRAVALPGAITLSFLPYADATPWLAAAAERRGHEVLVHEPMQATGGENPGPQELRTDFAPAKIRSLLAAALSRVPGAIGINNHMGSAFTADGNALIPVAEELAARHLLFFDSRTTPDTKVVGVAHAFGVASAERDVFLDDEVTANGVDVQIVELEAKARRQGVAIAIGHPHDVTLTAIAAWSANSASRGFRIVPLSEAIRMKTEYAVRLGLAETK